MPAKKPLNKKSIYLFANCELCTNERPDGISLREWGRLEVGLTKKGFQVWCIRHDCNVVHVDFEGHKHPMDGTRQLKTSDGGKIKPSTEQN